MQNVIKLDSAVQQKLCEPGLARDLAVQVALKAATGAMSSDREPYRFTFPMQQVFGDSVTTQGEVHPRREGAHTRFNRVVFPDGYYRFDYCSGEVVGFVPAAEATPYGDDDGAFSGAAWSETEDDAA